MSRLDKVARMSLIALLMGSMIFAYWQQAATGSPMQLGIAILLSVVTIGGGASVTVILRSLSTIGDKVDKLDTKVTRLEEGQKDLVRRVDDIEEMKRMRDEKCSRHETDIAIIKSKLEGLE